MSVKLRIHVEKKIVGATVKSLIDAGYFLNVDDGECAQDEFCLPAPTQDYKAIMAAMFSVDDEWLFVFKSGKSKNHFGWVRFIYGNSGWDVTNDYTTNLEYVMSGRNAGVSDRYERLFGDL